MRFKNKDQAVAYIAGFIDGEGSVRFLRHKNGKRKGKVSARSIAVYNTEKELIDAYIEACDMVDIDTSLHYSYPKSKQDRNEKPVWIASITHSRNLKLVSEIIPIQSIHKKDKLSQILNSYEHKTWKWKDVPVEELKQKYEVENLSMNKCAEYFKVNLVTIHRWIHKAGIKPKPKGKIY